MISIHNDFLMIYTFMQHKTKEPVEHKIRKPVIMTKNDVLLISSFLPTLIAEHTSKSHPPPEAPQTSPLSTPGQCTLVMGRWVVGGTRDGL